MHGFGMHVGIRYQYWGEGDIAGFGCVCFQEVVGSRSCDLYLGMDDFLGNSEGQGEHWLCIAVLHTWDSCVPLAASATPQMLPVAALLFLLAVG